MAKKTNQNKLIHFVTGLAGGALLYHSVLWLNDLVITPRQAMEVRNDLVTTLQEENRQLSEDLFRTANPLASTSSDRNLPYDENADAGQAIEQARERAREEKRFLMVTFGANWCMDCRNLHRALKTKEVQDYTRDSFLFVNVDIGKFNKNTEVAANLGVSLKKGIPVAIIYNTDGQVVGTTNEGQLEPARRYSSRQILKFVRDVAERSRILAPDAVR